MIIMRYLVKDKAVNADVNALYYVPNINSQEYLFRVLWAEIRCCDPTVKFEGIYSVTFAYGVFIFHE